MMRLLDIIAETDNTLTNMNKEGEWTLEDLAKGCEFTLRKGGTVWVMGEPQGMDGGFVYCHHKAARSVRPGHGPIHRKQMFKITQVIYSSDCA
jgi:hypothetical protein